MAPADRPTHDDVVTLADSLARSYGPGALARALVVRLRADQRPELADAVRALFVAVAAESRVDTGAMADLDGAIIDPNPPNPGGVPQ